MEVLCGLLVCAVVDSTYVTTSTASDENTCYTQSNRRCCLRHPRYRVTDAIKQPSTSRVAEAVKHLVLPTPSTSRFVDAIKQCLSVPTLSHVSCCRRHQTPRVADPIKQRLLPPFTGAVKQIVYLTPSNTAFTDAVKLIMMLTSLPTLSTNFVLQTYVD